MKTVFLVLKTSREDWAEAAIDVYRRKLERFCDFEIHVLKSKSHARDQAERKVRQEETQILEFLKKDDFVVAWDEGGWLAKDSEAFANRFGKVLESGRSRLVWVVGGPYGLGDEVRRRANLTLSLSPLTFNHFVAQVAALEQIYRAFCILKGIPYHNPKEGH